jgi:hypothetical protein
MHVLAAAIYTGCKRALSLNHESYSQWFTRTLRDVRLRGSKLLQTFSNPLPFAEHSRLMIAISRYSADRSRMTGNRR